nr:hypothetical protein [Cressdnaviricota sp.]
MSSRSFSTPLSRPRVPNLTIEPRSRRRPTSTVLHPNTLAVRMYQELHNQVLNYMHARGEFLPIPGIPHNHRIYRRFETEITSLLEFLVGDIRPQVYNHVIDSEELYHEITSTLAMHSTGTDEFAGFYRALNSWFCSNSSRLQRQMNVEDRFEMYDTQRRNLFHDEL